MCSTMGGLTTTFIFQFKMDVTFQNMNMYVFGGLSSNERFPFAVFSTIVPNRFLLSVIWLPKRQQENGETAQAQALAPQWNWKNSNPPSHSEICDKK